MRLTSRCTIPVWPALVLFLAAGCRTERETDVADTQDRVGEDADVDADLEVPGAGEDVIVTATFQPDAGAAGQPIAGSVEIVPQAPGDDLEARVRVTGLTPGEHAWHIHSAACGAEAPVVVAFTSTKELEGTAGPLDAGSDGVAQGSGEIPADRLTRQQIESGSYSVHVHAKGGVDHGPSVACANI
ncbi:MAG TPA: CHRD domain-containing protein [Gemmatimonadota bacterium]|jgi:hypothetical protein